MKTKNLILNSIKSTLIVAIFLLSSCKETVKSEMKDEAHTAMAKESQDVTIKLSLAQWSINQMIRFEGVDPYTFAEKAKNWGFTGLEYVSQLYPADLPNNEYSAEAMAQFIEKSKAASDKYGVENVLIMIDRQGNLAVDDEKERDKAVERHYKWVDAAAALGCHAIRVNLAGSNVPENWKKNSVDGLTKLATYAKTKNINIVVENHGGLSSNGAMLAEVMKLVNLDNCGSLPDFGNFCIKRKDPKDYSAGCAEMYDIYKGVAELMPSAKAVSAKAHDFDEDGNETNIDYTKMLQIVKDAGYTGYIGVEYEGNILSEEKGIMATKNLILRASKELK